ncbi:MAG: VWA domain-containing protein [Bacteroidia bacterium]
MKAQSLISEPGELDFGTVESAASLRSFLVLRNNSAKIVYLLRADSPKNMDVYTSGKKIAPGDTLHLRFMYTPPAPGKVNEEISLVHSAADKPMRIRISGQINTIAGNALTNCVNFDPKDGSAGPGAVIPLITSHEVLLTDLNTGDKLKSGTIVYTSLRSGEKFTRAVNLGRLQTTLPVDLYAVEIEAPGYKSQHREFYMGASGMRSVYTLEPEKKAPVPEVTIQRPPDEPRASSEPPPPAGELDENLYKPNNLIFLVDISGSMREPQKLPLLKQSVFTLLEPIRPIDKISVIAYSSNAEIVVPPTGGNHKEEIYSKLDTMQAGGTTAGSEGIRKAYELAMQSYIPEGNNRIILATDGAFRVSGKERELIESSALSNNKPVYLTILAFDSESDDLDMLSTLAKLGKGDAVPIKKGRQAERILLNEVKKQSRR